MGAGAGAGFGAELGFKAFPAAGVGTSSSSKASNGDAIVCRRKEFTPTPPPRFEEKNERSDFNIRVPVAGGPLLPFLMLYFTPFQPLLPPCLTLTLAPRGTRVA